MTRWFRFYDGALDDPKVQRLPAELYKAWINFLCLASRGGGKLPDIEDIAFALRVTRDTTRDWLDALREHGLIDVDPDDGSFSPHNWSRRQFKSDGDPTAAERQRRKRAKGSGAKPKAKRKNVTRDVTPPRTEQNRTEQRAVDTEVPNPEPGSGPPKLSLVEPHAPTSVGTRLSSDWKPDEAGRALAVTTLGSNAAARAELDKFRDHWRGAAGARGRKVDWDATWRNWLRRTGEMNLNARAPPHSVRKITALSTLQRIANGTHEPEPDDGSCDTQSSGGFGPTIEGVVVGGRQRD